MRSAERDTTVRTGLKAITVVEHTTTKARKAFILEGNFVGKSGGSVEKEKVERVKQPRTRRMSDTMAFWLMWESTIDINTCFFVFCMRERL